MTPAGQRKQDTDDLLCWLLGLLTILQHAPRVTGPSGGMHVELPIQVVTDIAFGLDRLIARQRIELVRIGRDASATE